MVPFLFLKLFSFLLLPILYSSHTILDVDELSVQYGIEITSKPVILNSQPVNENILHLSSKHGQLYSCFLPQLPQDQDQELNSGTPAENVIDILDKALNGTCLTHKKGWWTYKLCHKQSITQYHVGELGDAEGPTTHIGSFSTEDDWSREENTERKPSEMFHSHHYANGSVCDVTQDSRKATVQYFCASKPLDSIIRIEEPATCEYIITVHSTKLCTHPLFLKKEAKKQISLVCSPALMEHEYNKYMEKLNKKKAAEEVKKKELLKKKMEELDKTGKKESIFDLSAGNLLPKGDSLEEHKGKFKNAVNDIASFMKGFMKVLNIKTEDVKLTTQLIKDGTEVEGTKENINIDELESELNDNVITKDVISMIEDDKGDVNLHEDKNNKLIEKSTKVIQDKVTDSDIKHDIDDAVKDDMKIAWKETAPETGVELTNVDETKKPGSLKTLNDFTESMIKQLEQDSERMLKKSSKEREMMHEEFDRVRQNTLKELGNSRNMLDVLKSLKKEGRSAQSENELEQQIKEVHTLIVNLQAQIKQIDEKRKRVDELEKKTNKRLDEINKKIHSTKTAHEFAKTLEGMAGEKNSEDYFKNVISSIFENKDEPKGIEAEKEVNSEKIVNKDNDDDTDPDDDFDDNDNDMFDADDDVEKKLKDDENEYMTFKHLDDELSKIGEGKITENTGVIDLLKELKTGKKNDGDKGAKKSSESDSQKTDVKDDDFESLKSLLSNEKVTTPEGIKDMFKKTTEELGKWRSKKKSDGDNTVTDKESDSGLLADDDFDSLKSSLLKEQKVTTPEGIKDMLKKTTEELGKWRSKKKNDGDNTVTDKESDSGLLADDDFDSLKSSLLKEQKVATMKRMKDMLKKTTDELGKLRGKRKNDGDNSVTDIKISNPESDSDLLEDDLIPDDFFPRDNFRKLTVEEKREYTKKARKMLKEVQNGKLDLKKFGENVNVNEGDDVKSDGDVDDAKVDDDKDLDMEERVRRAKRIKEKHNSELVQKAIKSLRDEIGKLRGDMKSSILFPKDDETAGKEKRDIDDDTSVDVAKDSKTGLESVVTLLKKEMGKLNGKIKKAKDIVSPAARAKDGKEKELIEETEKDTKNKMEVRIRTMDEKSFDKEFSKSVDESVREEVKEATKKMEATVKKQLKDSGLDFGDNIKIKIITTKDKFDQFNNGKDVKLLSDEDAADFKDLLLGFLGGGKEKVTEERRQKTLETNYNFKLDEDDDESEL